ncbi:MAG: hypothetical protein ACKV2T_14120 [Kofleriaceae bacterium]
MPCEQWQAGDLLYEPDSGKLWTYLLAPVQQPLVDAWFETMDAAFTRTP